MYFMILDLFWYACTGLKIIQIVISKVYLTAASRVKLIHT